MVIDDDEEDALIFCEVIKELVPNITCIVVHSAEQAQITVAEETAPDFIFLDALMYPMGGKECLAMLNRITKLENTQIIIHSGVVGPDQIREFKALGADHVIPKSSSYDSFSKSLKEILF